MRLKDEIFDKLSGIYRDRGMIPSLSDIVTDVLGEVDSETERLRAALATMKAQFDAAQAWPQDGDMPLPEDAAIDAAFPTRAGRHDLFIEAMRLVGARSSKGGLVALVNWLLADAEAVRAERDAARRASDFLPDLDRRVAALKAERDAEKVRAASLAALLQADRVRIACAWDTSLAELDAALAEVKRLKSGAGHDVRQADHIAKVLIHAADQKTERAERRAELLEARQRLFWTECVRCKCALLEPDSPPHCEDCSVDDEHREAWADARAELDSKLEPAGT